jgi:hypothetical protein
VYHVSYYQNVTKADPEKRAAALERSRAWRLAHPVETKRGAIERAVRLRSEKSAMNKKLPLPVASDRPRVRSSKFVLMENPPKPPEEEEGEKKPKNKGGRPRKKKEVAESATS